MRAGTLPARRRRRWSSALETFERRALLTGTITVPLDPALDQFGDQIATVMAYEGGSKVTFGIFDTGASAVTVGASDQALFEFFDDPIPIKVPGGAIAGGIGGAIIGDVSMPGTILADGFHAAALTFDPDGFPVFNMTLGEGSAETSNIQVFVGTESGSPLLPTITGTPILVRSPEHPDGLAAKVEMTGATIDFSELFEGLVVSIPDVHFVAPTTTLSPTPDTTQVVKFPLEPFGFDNYANPGDLITEWFIQLIPDVAANDGPHATSGGHFLFDTGAQLTVVSSEVAANLGLDLDNPETTITVQGVAGAMDIPGYTLDALTLRAIDNTLVRLTDIPIYVLDVAEGIDGILGMNAFNTAHEFLFNPLDPAGASLSVTYLTNPDRGDLPDLGPFGVLLGQGRNLGLLNTFRGRGVPQFDVGQKTDVQVTAPSASVYGQTQTFQVALSGGATGQVHLMEGDRVLATATVDQGQARLQVAGLPAGTHSLKVHYAGDLTHRAASTRPLSLVVAKAAPIVSVSTQVGPVVVGQPMLVSAVVAAQPNGPAGPSGTVKFFDGDTFLGSATVPANGGVASTTVRVPDAGSRAIRAVYEGDANHQAGTASVARSIGKAATTTTVKVDRVMKGRPGRQVLDSFQVTLKVGVVAPGQTAVGGNVVVTVGRTKRTVRLANGVATFKLSPSSGANQPVVASFAGDGRLQGSASKKLTTPRR